MKTLLLVSLFYGAWCCPNGWIRLESSCYHFSREPEPWPGADYMCNKMGGKLVEIETAEENAVLTPIIKSFNRNYWMGLSVVQVEGVWLWMTSKSKLSTSAFSNWKSGAPSNTEGKEHCAAINHDSNGEWNDWFCYRNTFYICEQEIQKETGVIVG